MATKEKLKELQDKYKKSSSDIVKKNLKLIIDKMKRDLEEVGGEVEKEVEKVKKTPKKKTPKKKAPTKSDYEKAKADLKRKTGKSQEDCEKIIEEYKALRSKSQKRKIKETQAKDDNKKRVDKLKKDDKVIKGTTEKDTASTLDTTAEKVEKKIEKEVEKVEKEVERKVKEEVTAKVEKDKTTTPTQKKEKIKKEVKEKVKEEVKKEGKKIVAKVVIDTKSIIEAISNSLAKYDKDLQKEYLIKLRSDIDKLLTKYMYGGNLTDGALASANVTQSQMSESSVNPTKYAKGGSTYGRVVVEINKDFLV